ncbi:MAG: 3-phosphoshikimate 1-carboxyvinyltransferase [Alphaproteobacteria bacterium]|nr:3-phosphoshikimate 1-carboxyvinyltransferase [Alphaproteobacteria bacterium]
MTEIAPAGPVRGTVEVPGDKSISHRALLLNALATGSARVRGLLRGEDVLRSLAAVRALGVQVDDDGTELVVHGTGKLVEPDDVIDCGNSGTTTRLLVGILAAEPFFSVLTGDGSLRGRPMGRVVAPLRSLGARIDGRGDGTRCPLAIRGGGLRRGDHVLPVASAQVKTALLLAGRREGASVREPGVSRDHTERMLARMGAGLTVHDGGTHLVLEPVERLDPLDVDVPRDLSSAAFWLVAASILPGSSLRLPRVLVNPTRAGVIDALQAMGAAVQVRPIEAAGAEPVADLEVTAAPLRGTRIAGDLALRCLDELPVLAVAAAFADGDTEIRDAEELRVKESDRIARVCVGLRALGVEVEELPDGMIVRGGRPTGPARIDARGDHRLAMAFAVAGCAAPGGVRIDGSEGVATSYPGFWTDLSRLRA